MQLGKLVSSLITIVYFLPSATFAQKFVVESRIETSGTIRAVNDDKLTIADVDGDISVYKIQCKDRQAVSIDGDWLRAPAEIRVAGKIATRILQPGMVVRFHVMLRNGGRSIEEISSLELLPADYEVTGVKVIDSQETSKQASCEVVGQIKLFRNNQLTVLVPDSPYASKNRVRVEVSETAEVAIERDDLTMVQTGDKVVSLSAIKLKTGYLVIESIRIELQNDRDLNPASATEVVTQYQHLSDAPRPPRDVRSQHFLLHTDISDRQGQILLDKLETMIDLVAQYYGRPLRGMIECYVVRDISNWPEDAFPLDARQKILEPAGVTLTVSLGQQRRSMVYSCDQHQIVQHESVHAWCAQTFGSAGPVWYAEGMAEMGAYWKEGELEVDIHPGVIEYLRNAPPKKMLDIVAEEQFTGDSWQAYAWRWALCHLLVHNPNYSRRMKGLGIAMMSGEEASFEATYGDIASHISFEYDQFVRNFGNGYRADLTAWQWDVQARPLSGSRTATETIAAARGWQATGVLLQKDQSYDVATLGTWQIAKAGEDLTADGNAVGAGRLIGAVFRDFRLSAPFELSAKHSFAAPSDGQLYLRCQDSWTELSDNEGKIKVHFRVTPEVSR